jgi:FKBP-type peptidyl-prolyl cis-trans isomerase FkpA
MMKRQSTRWAKLGVSLCVGTATLICAFNAMSAEGTAADATANTSASASVPPPARTNADGLVTTDSGLQYLDLSMGKGTIAQAGDTVSVHYTGWLQNADGSLGKKFDSSRDRRQPLTFRLGQHMVIKGWDEGVQGMRVGGQRRLIVPSELGYGSRGAGGGKIPPDSTLIFEVALINVK